MRASEEYVLLFLRTSEHSTQLCKLFSGCSIRSFLRGLENFGKQEGGFGGHFGKHEDEVGTQITTSRYYILPKDQCVSRVALFILYIHEHLFITGPVESVVGVKWVGTPRLSAPRDDWEVSECSHTPLRLFLCEWAPGNTRAMNEGPLQHELDSERKFIIFLFIFSRNERYDTF